MYSSTAQIDLERGAISAGALHGPTHDSGKRNVDTGANGGGSLPRSLARSLSLSLAPLSFARSLSHIHALAHARTHPLSPSLFIALSRYHSISLSRSLTLSLSHTRSL
jgi:hypothetical protein